MHTDSQQYRLRRVTLGLAMALGATAAWAQQATGPTLDEIIVTAQKREEALRDVPISVSAVDSAKIRDAGIVRLDDLKAYVPNLQVTETGIANNFYVRGIGSGLNQGFEQSVSIYADGVYRGRGPQSRFPFLDLERVEVLRGPQPILFGKNAIAGAVNLVSARPTESFEGMARGSYEFENGEYLADLVFSGPLTDTFGARLAVRYREADGYVENLRLSRDEPDREERAARLTLEWAPSDDFEAILRIEAGEFDIEGRQVEVYGELPAAAWRKPDGTTGTPPIPGLTYSQILAGAFGQDPSVLNNTLDNLRSSNGDMSDTDTREFSLTLNWRLGGMTLTSVSAYSEYDLDEICDCDFTGASVFSAGIEEDYEQWSQELRLASDTDQRISWIAGLFYQDYDLEEFDYIFVPADSIVIPLVNITNPGAGPAFANTANPRHFDQDSELFAVFAQATWNVTEALRLTAGGRWSTEDKDGSRVTDLTDGVGGPSLGGPPSLIDTLYGAVFGIQRHSVSGKRSEDNFSPLLNVQYDFNDDIMGYASYTRGYKAGGFDARSNRSPAQGGTFEYRKEKADAYEVGAKFAIGAAAEVNAAVFYTDYEDLQTSAFDGRIGFNVGNGSAEIRGVEVDGRWQATDHLYVFGSVAYLDFEWQDYDGQCYFNPPAGLLSTSVPGNCNYDGETNQLSPDWTAVLGAEYRIPIGYGLELGAAADMLYSDRYLTSLTLDPNSAQASYAKFNARLALGPPSRQWEVALIGRNITDQTVVSYSGDVPLAGSTFGARSYYGFVDPPRTVALEGTVRF